MKFSSFGECDGPCFIFRHGRSASSAFETIVFHASGRYPGSSGGVRFDKTGRIGVGHIQRMQSAGAVPLHAIHQPLFSLDGHHRTDFDQFRR